MPISHFPINLLHHSSLPLCMCVVCNACIAASSSLPLLSAPPKARSLSRSTSACFLIRLGEHVRPSCQPQISVSLFLYLSTYCARAKFALRSSKSPDSPLLRKSESSADVIGERNGRKCAAGNRKMIEFDDFWPRGRLRPQRHSEQSSSRKEEFAGGTFKERVRESRGTLPNLERSVKEERIKWDFPLPFLLIAGT